MNYELTKELKEVGFPQYGEGVSFRHPMTDEPIYAPTLTELIEACGEDFGALERCITGEWRACNVEYSHTPTKDTPEEAVACLWLALSKEITSI